MVVWESVPTRVSGIRPSTAVVVGSDDRARYSRFTWCTMPVPGGTTRKLSKRLLAPAQELVALAVALELELDVRSQRAVGAELVHLHRVVDHQIDRHAAD